MSDLSREIRRYPTYLPSGLHTEEIADALEAKDAEIERLNQLINSYRDQLPKLGARIEELEADLALLRPVCVPNTVANAHIVMCRHCKGTGTEALAACEDKDSHSLSSKPPHMREDK
jgi:chromosome segregation ATPase